MSFLDPTGLNAPAGFLNPPGGGAAPAPTPPPPMTPPQGVLPAPAQAADDDDTPTTPQQPQGFLSRLTAPTPDGITFQDRLMALGSILKGDGAGAQSYLKDRRAVAATAAVAAQKVKDQEAAAAAQQKASEILASSFDKDGNFQFQSYAQKMAAAGLGQKMEDVARAGALRTKLDPVNLGRLGGVDAFNPFAGTATQVVAPQPAAAPANYRMKADGSGVEPIPGGPADPAVIEAGAHAKRLGAPLAGRAGSAKANPFSSLSSEQIRAALGGK